MKYAESRKLVALESLQNAPSGLPARGGKRARSYGAIGILNLVKAVVDGHLDCSIEILIIHHAVCEKPNSEYQPAIWKMDSHQNALFDLQTSPVGKQSGSSKPLHVLKPALPKDRDTLPFMPVCEVRCVRRTNLIAEISKRTTGSRDIALRAHVIALWVILRLGTGREEGTFALYTQPPCVSAGI